MNKIKALKAAQDRAVEFLNYGDTVEIKENLNDFTVKSTDDDGTSIEHSFPFEEPRPMAQDTLCLCDDRILRYAQGIIKDGVNAFYIPGVSSKNVGEKTLKQYFDHFEIIETPADFETLQTFELSPCVGCWSAKNGMGPTVDCESCTVKISKPTGWRKE